MYLRKVLFVIIVIFSKFTKAQSSLNLLNNIGQKTADQVVANSNIPIPYGYIDDRDILWSKMVWEYIDLDEKINLPYYYPADIFSIGSKRRSLFDTLLNGIKNNTITEVYEDSYFEHKISSKKIEQTLTKIDTTDQGIERLNFGLPLRPKDINITTINAGDIEGFKIKGLYYFDKRQGEVKYRLLGIAPVALNVYTLSQGNNYEYNLTELVSLFWVWYPGARNTTHKMIVFNSKNGSYPLSYDLLLNARRFNTIIYQEENSHAFHIKKNSLMRVFESTKIKNRIREFELDMQNY
ncbi:MAG: gliding motility protein GldN [Flavobacteriaceae bacterium]|nr:gliding motility protein GldN [Flavobacteriaceae bacterium]